jgi:hypothetical protein
MAERYLIFQTASENPMAMTRLRSYLSRHGWQRVSTGVYVTVAGASFDEQAFWTRLRDDFYLDPERDFVAVIHTESAFIPTQRYYNKPAPPWPKDYPYAPAEDA